MHDLTDRDLSTWFLGDLYQDLSEHAKKTYALLQTPVFVEEFPRPDPRTRPGRAPPGGVQADRPHLRSGHFLLGAFNRLVTRWQQQNPSLCDDETTTRALDSVHGVDINPFAVAIARFRLTVAALHHTGRTSLDNRF